MRPEHLPYPLTPAQKPITLTEAEVNAILVALAVGWKAHVQQYHLIQSALAVARPHAARWAGMSIAEKRALLPNPEIKDEWLSDGWPLSGLWSKIARYDHQLPRIGHAVATANLLESRRVAIREQIHVVIPLDEQFMRDAENMRAKIDAAMKESPKDAVALASNVASVVDKEFFIAGYMKERANTTDFKVFADSYKVEAEIKTVVEG